MAPNKNYRRGNGNSGDGNSGDGNSSNGNNNNRNNGNGNGDNGNTSQNRNNQSNNNYRNSDGTNQNNTNNYKGNKGNGTQSSNRNYNNGNSNGSKRNNDNNGGGGKNPNWNNGGNGNNPGGNPGGNNQGPSHFNNGNNRWQDNNNNQNGNPATYGRFGIPTTYDQHGNPINSGKRKNKAGPEGRNNNAVNPNLRAEYSDAHKSKFFSGLGPYVKGDGSESVPRTGNPHIDYPFSYRLPFSIDSSLDAKAKSETLRAQFQNMHPDLLGDSFYKRFLYNAWAASPEKPLKGIFRTNTFRQLLDLGDADMIAAEVCHFLCGVFQTMYGEGFMHDDMYMCDCDGTVPRCLMTVFLEMARKVECLEHQINKTKNMLLGNDARPSASHAAQRAAAVALAAQLAQAADAKPPIVEEIQ